MWQMDSSISSGFCVRHRDSKKCHIKTVPRYITDSVICGRVCVGTRGETTAIFIVNDTMETHTTFFWQTDLHLVLSPTRTLTGCNKVSTLTTRRVLWLFAQLQGTWEGACVLEAPRLCMSTRVNVTIVTVVERVGLRHARACAHVPAVCI